MHLRIRGVLVFSSVILCCVLLPVNAAIDPSEGNFYTSIISHVNRFSRAATTGIVWNQTNAEIDELQQAECKCKYGKCVRDGPKQVCTCEPEFALVNPTECHYCDCGMGFNCTFYRTTRNVFGYDKTCICPEGYTSIYGYCRAKCNETHPCQNGGSCINEKCDCKRGTMGDYCESIFWCSYECRPRLIVDCVYDQEAEWFKCQCKNKSLYFDYRKYICMPCPCGKGECKYDRHHELYCECNDGYKVFNGYCKRCNCGKNGECEFNSLGEKMCKCRDNYVSEKGYCVACGCDFGDNTNIQCTMNDGVKHCFCPQGYESCYGECRDIDECKFNDTCHPTMKCINTPGSFKCECEEGYGPVDSEYPEDGCTDIDECIEDLPCISWKENCVNLPGTYKCECKDGFIPTNLKADPRNIQCDKYKESWLPAGIAIVTGIAVLTVAIVAMKYVEYRSRR